MNREQSVYQPIHVHKTDRHICSYGTRPMLNKDSWIEYANKAFNFWCFRDDNLRVQSLGVTREQ